MKKVLLVCSASLTSSILSSRLQIYSNQNHLNLLFQAIPFINLNLSMTDADCILLTPQVRFGKNEIVRMVSQGKNIPVVLIDVLDYEQSRVESICNLVLSIIKE